MRSAWSLALAIAGCGRMGFDATVDAASDGAAPIAFVQASAANAGIAPVTSMVTVALPQPVAHGDLLLVSIGHGDSSIGVTAIADSVGTQYTVAVTQPWATSDAEELFYGASAGSGANSVTVMTSSVPPTFFEVRVYEYAGVGPLDAMASVAGAGTQASCIVTATAAGLVFAVGQLDVATTITADAAFTPRPVAADGGGMLAEDRTIGAAGQFAATESFGAAGNWAMLVAVFAAR